MRLAAGLAALTLSACGIPGFAPSVALPTASAILHWGKVDLLRASYCWSSGGHGECADSPGPDILVKVGDLKPYRTAGGFDVTIKFHSSSTLKGFGVQLLQSPDGKSGPIALNGADTFPLGMSPPSSVGLFVYVIRSVWPEGSVDFFLALDLIPGVA